MPIRFTKGGFALTTELLPHSSELFFRFGDVLANSPPEISAIFPGPA
jgi:hypothetical protein